MGAALQVRVAREADLDRLVEIHRGAFPDPRSGLVRLRNFEHNPLGPLSCLRVVERDGALLAHAFLFALTGAFGAREVGVGAIASLGVAPEARGAGIGRRLLAHLHEESRVRGDAVTLLHPFRQGFYTSLGYAPVSPYRRIVASPRSIPRAFGEGPSTVRIQAAEGEDREGIERLHARVGLRFTGSLLRPAALWDALFLEEKRAWFVAERDGAPVGYVAWRAEQTEAHAAVDLFVDDLVAEDEEARRRLLGLIGRQRDQVRSFRMLLDAHDPIDRVLVDADSFRFGDQALEHSLGELVLGPMVRIHEPQSALEARGYAIDGELSLRVTDDLPTGSPRRLRVVGGVASVTSESLAEASADVELDRVTLAAVLYGALLPSDAARLGALQARDQDALARADALLRLPPFFCVDAF